MKNYFWGLLNGLFVVMSVAVIGELPIIAWLFTMLIGGCAINLPFLLFEAVEEIKHDKERKD